MALSASGAWGHVHAHTCDAEEEFLDIRMPTLDGIEATRQLAGAGVDGPIAVGVITTFDTDEHVHGALKAGARGSPQPSRTRHVGLRNETRGLAKEAEHLAVAAPSENRRDLRRSSTHHTHLSAECEP